MQITQYTNEVIKELNRTVSLISEESAEKLVEHILQAERIFVAGAGRSGLMMKAFAMRMMHMGLQVYVVGESVTPGLSKEDLLIIGSGSGETKSLLAMAAKAASLGAAVAITTVIPDSSIGRLADLVIQIPALSKDTTDSGLTSIQPMGSLFEQSILLLFDSIILQMMIRLDLDSSAMFGNHANLE
ncbi:6-phospho-3-hexuloisomerase [Paenibacillus radicis (ex Xue et al. 2023)]|uniref:6-phospho-3-hexuloisomerase n=1 Tax=Paenibacillus radicis (ex Xue et al. 2023) TaxID=2972489 RepID=A0ABT1YKX0_9BACL|nr:6-phospho-3-hexuloisomerase [Paenibacillus radicis (ex Xue et al. 2023)]MCR8632610.1 6-phospho-3-hexuloisomerase [Paenibacillus radicis (ex Xue et al. 2023)]